MRILIVEDEVRLADALVQILKTQRYDAETVYDGNDGLDYALSGQYDVIILDVMLPGKNGFEIVREMRAQKIATPVLMLTAKDEVSDKINGLDCGADDYMTKPFIPEELLARIRAMSRRKGEVVINEMSFADLTLSLATYDLAANGKSIRLGFKEFEVMKILMSNTGAIVKKDDLISKVWGMDSEAEDNNVEVYISFLRKKLFFIGSRAEITTVRKVGYKLEDKKL